ncbi:MAG: class II aldolase/adducin family protein, partial [Planctomycetes bacterium]|nr:class II aldolase/adducin family protein [Planctomycetota bacterium]
MRLTEKYSDQVKAFCKICQSLASDKFVTGTGGNLAWKLEDDLILITPTQVNKGDVGVEDVVFIRPDGEKVEGRLRPTGEVPMYLKFFKERPDIKS